MVLSRGLVISLGVSALGCTLLFLYFRNKISAVERKVDVMFDLIQNHQQQNSMENRQYNEVIHEKQEQQEQQQQQNIGAWAHDEPEQERNLIEVSDEDTDDAIPSLGMLATMVSILSAGVLFQRTSREQ